MTDPTNEAEQPDAQVDAAGLPLPDHETATDDDADTDVTDAEAKMEAEAARLGDFA